MNRSIIVLAAVLAAVPAAAADSPLESDFPEGYWDREFSYGRHTSNYNISIAAEDTSTARRKAESVLKAAGGTMTGFNDMTFSVIPENSRSADSARPAYTLTFQLTESKAGAAARELIPLGRMISFNSGSPYGVAQTKDIEERIEWIEKEKRQGAAALKTMPVSRAMLESKLKRLRQQLDQTKTGRGAATVTVQIMRELPASERGPAVTP